MGTPNNTNPGNVGPYTDPNKGISYPGHGLANDVWDTPVNVNWDAIDNAFGGSAIIHVLGVVADTYPLTLDQYQPPNIIFTDALSADLNYQFPAGVGGIWSVLNSTSVAHKITLSSASGPGTVVLPQGKRTLVICDDTGVQLADTSQVPLPANPTAKVGTVAVNGSPSTTTYMRSDAAPAIDTSASFDPTWQGTHTFDGAVNLNNTVTLGAGKSFAGTAGHVDVPTVAISTGNTSAASTSAVKSYAAPIASPALTGTPTVVGTPPPPTDSSTKIATTAFVQAVANGTTVFSTDGYEISPTGKVTIWGTSGTSTNTLTQAVSFASILAGGFPHACLNVQVTNENTLELFYSVTGVSKTGFTLQASNGGGGFCYWYATGY